MSGPFKMSGSQFLGKGNQSKPGMPMYDSPAQKALVGDQNNLPEDLQAKIEASPATYATPAKNKNEKTYSKKEGKIKKTTESTKPKLNEFGETPEQYKARMKEMGLQNNKNND